MPQQIIGISSPDDGLGDVLRTGFAKTNENFTELYNGKVDKVTGKGLSENDFTDADKSKLDGIEADAQVNVQADWGETDPLADSFIQNKPPSLYSAFGYFHYADLDTQTTPLNFVALTPLQLINDTLGVFTNEDQAPYGISSVWDKPTDSLDFSQLSVGDAVLFRADLSISTTSVNQNLQLYIKFGIGTPSEYDLLIDSWNEKSVVSFKHFIKDVSFSIDNTDWRDAPAKIYLLSDDNGSVKVNGWYIPIIRKSLNIIDFNSDPTKVDKVSTTGVERAYIINADGSQGTKATSSFGGKSKFIVKDFLVATNLTTTWRFRAYASATSYTPTVLDSGTSTFLTALTGSGTSSIPYQTHNTFVAPFDVKLKSIEVCKTDVFGSESFSLGIGMHLKNDASNIVTDGVSILEVNLLKGSFTNLKKKYTPTDFGDVTLLAGHSIVVGWINQGRGIELYFEFEEV